VFTIRCTCGKAAPFRAKLCPRCGKATSSINYVRQYFKITRAVCACGKAAPFRAKFCPGCGKATSSKNYEHQYFKIACVVGIAVAIMLCVPWAGTKPTKGASDVPREPDMIITVKPDEVASIPSRYLASSSVWWRPESPIEQKLTILDAESCAEETAWLKLDPDDPKTTFRTKQPVDRILLRLLKGTNAPVKVHYGYK
jgi:hypothetical protein